MTQSSQTNHPANPTGGTFRPVLFLFLVAGVFVVIPYLLLTPTQICIRAAWNKRPGIVWRVACLVSVVTAFTVTCPPSPFFVGLDGPISLAIFPPQTAYYPTVWSFLVSQCYLTNAALIAAMICFPLTAASTLATFLSKDRFSKSSNN